MMVIIILSHITVLQEMHLCCPEVAILLMLSDFLYGTFPGYSSSGRSLSDDLDQFSDARLQGI